VTDTAWVILISYSALVIIGVAAALIIFRSTRVGFRVRVADRETLERREGFWGIAVVAFLVAVLAGTIFSVPYWSDDESEAAQKIEITGRQFAFTIDPPQVKAGVPTEIDLHAADVNHAIGIYNPDGTLIKQVNMLPGVTQTLTMTFDRRGSYEVRCLEFCGIDHHLMENQLQVR
jgi:cytochrome c oxidase subunit 2